jgi:hypothetical protein
MTGGAVAAIVIVAETDLVLSVADVAVAVTVAGVGTELGAVKVVDEPLAVAVGLKLPHCALPQVTVQLTPPFLVSLLTEAPMLVVVLMTNVEGGCVTNETEIGGGGPLDAIVIEADTDFVLSVMDVAVTVTVAGDGTALGAV